jgi:hypothetical protein
MKPEDEPAIIGEPGSNILRIAGIPKPPMNRSNRRSISVRKVWKKSGPTNGAAACCFTGTGLDAIAILLSLWREVHDRKKTRLCIDLDQRRGMQQPA